MTNFSRSLTLIFALLALTFTAGANPINVTFLNTESSGNTGPYNFTFGTDPTVLHLLCISDDRTIYNGETWKANLDPITDFSDIGITEIQLQRADELFGYMNLNTAYWTPIHEAVWNTVGTGSFSFNLSSTDPNDPGYWMHAANSVPINSLPTNFSILVPVAGTQSGGYGTPQMFLYNGPPNTPGVPEPATMFMLDTGLIGLGLVGRKRRKAARLGIHQVK
jgi:hypothetical protein